MKLLLTSAGIQNKSIAKAILDLTGLPAAKINLAFIPTAANVEENDKGWLIDDLVNFQKQRYKSIDIVDIAAIPRDIWQPRLEKANLFCFGGGNEQYLARIMRESGLSDLLPELLKTRVYMGISAGSMVAGRSPSKKSLEIVYPEDEIGIELESALNFINCNIFPHFNSSSFPQIRKEILESLKDVTAPIYALDDQSALKVIDGKIEVITEGEYFFK